jgi:hypothetical protein
MKSAKKKPDRQTNLNYVINFKFQNSFNCLALKVIYIHFVNLSKLCSACILCWYSCLFDVYMDCCSLSVTGPQTSTSQAILIKRYSKHYRHNVKSPYECFMDQNGVVTDHEQQSMYTSNRQLYHMERRSCLMLNACDM